MFIITLITFSKKEKTPQPPTVTFPVAYRILVFKKFNNLGEIIEHSLYILVFKKFNNLGEIVVYIFRIFNL